MPRRFSSRLAEKEKKQRHRRVATGADRPANGSSYYQKVVLAIKDSGTNRGITVTAIVNFIETNYATPPHPILKAKVREVVNAAVNQGLLAKNETGRLIRMGFSDRPLRMAPAGRKVTRREAKEQAHPAPVAQPKKRNAKKAGKKVAASSPASAPPDASTVAAKSTASTSTTKADAPKPSLSRTTTQMKKDQMMQQLLESAGGQPSGNDIEICFCFDTTISMFSCLEEVRAKLMGTITRLLEDIPGIRIAVIAQGDYDTKPYVIKSIDFSSDIGKLVAWVNDVEMVSGRTVPEAYELALTRASELSWKPEIKSKAFVMIGDSIPNAPGSVPGQLVKDWEKEAEVLAKKGVRVYAVQALPEALKKNVLVCDPKAATAFWTALADKTNGTYLQLRQFNVITEVFMELCYRQAAESQLGQYAKRVRDAGKTMQRSGSSQLLLSDQLAGDEISLTQDELLTIHRAIHSTERPSSVTVRGQEFPISFGHAGCRFATIELTPGHRWTLVEQNKDKNSTYAKMAIEGRAITWLVRSGRWGLIIDDTVVRN